MSWPAARAQVLEHRYPQTTRKFEVSKKKLLERKTERTEIMDWGVLWYSTDQLIQEINYRCDASVLLIRFGYKN